MSNNVIEKLWNEYECPDFEGIMYANGVVTDNIGELLPNSTLDYDETTFLAVFSKLDVTDKNISLLCGESASHGSDGFIAMVDSLSQNLIWLFYSKNSNPFESFTLKYEFVECHSTSGKVAKFKIQRKGVVIQIA